VHFPYCAAKCHYCDFYSLPGAGADVGGAVEALLAEAELRAPRSPSTVFFGGGTPSLLAPAELVRLFERLDAISGFRASAVEVTLEANPESLDSAKARLLRDLGVTRLSLGFQSLRPETLELFGRVHDVEQAFRAYDAARDAGIANVNVDLIYATPGQTLLEWEHDLQRVLELAPDHLSAYDLAFEEETRFSRWLAEGRIARAPEELELELFAATRSLTSERGLLAYEISNYARPGRECRHNWNYWRNGPYAGIGPSAASKIGHERGGNVRSVTLWKRALAERGHAFAWSEELAWPERLAETWWLGLRLAEGVEAALARATAGCAELADSRDPALEVAARLAASGHLERRAQRWTLPPGAVALADAVAARFLNDVPRSPLACASAGQT
jgi:oxygen-independent coproporphyrinogen-3 oxidase